MDGSGETRSPEVEMPGDCPVCGAPLGWLATEGDHHGRICRACAWVELPEVPAMEHTLGSVLRKVLPNSGLVPLVDYLGGLMRARREDK